MSTLSEQVIAAASKVKAEKKRAGPVWKGPEVDGITFSLLSRFLQCRERFRLYVVEGLKPADQFNHRIEYGNMWHICEEALAGKNDWELPLKLYASTLCAKYRMQQEQVEHWYNVCRTQFPLYVNYWSKHPDTLARTPLLQEAVFDVPYKLPSSRTVRLRGKWDAVDLIGESEVRRHAKNCQPAIGAGLYLMENKTKGEINEEQIKRQMTFDLQTMMYLVAMRERKNQTVTIFDPYPILGVRYNVIRRPLSGGVGTIRQHKPTKGNPTGETKEEFYTRLSDIISGSPETYFMQWKVEVTAGDVKRFQRECLDPILEQLCDWWGHMTCEWQEEGKLKRGIHWRHPFGARNMLDEGGSSDLDEYLASGSEAGLQRVDELFGELTT